MENGLLMKSIYLIKFKRQTKTNGTCQCVNYTLTTTIVTQDFLEQFLDELSFSSIK
jgi:hypothetical protein